MTLNERARQRLKDEKMRKHLSERDIAGILEWSQSRVTQKFGGRTPITLDELEALCFALGLSPTEVVRDHGLEFCAEMTPTELRVLERLRALAPHVRDAVFTLLDIKAARTVEDRGVTPKKPPIPRGRSNGTV